MPVFGQRGSWANVSQCLSSPCKGDGGSAGECTIEWLCSKNISTTMTTRCLNLNPEVVTTKKLFVYTARRLRGKTCMGTVTSAHCFKPNCFSSTDCLSSQTASHGKLQVTALCPLLQKDLLGMSSCGLQMGRFSIAPFLSFSCSSNWPFPLGDLCFY